MELRSHEGQVHRNARYFCKFDIFKRVSQTCKIVLPSAFVWQKFLRVYEVTHVPNGKMN